MKIFTKMKMLALVAGMMMTSNVMAGDGTKANPYTVAELNAQKDALAASGETVWVKADLKGLGEDGTKTDNAAVDNVRQMAGLFGDATGDFVAYSWQILGELTMSDLTNTKDLLIALTYGTEGHPYGNSTYPQYASKYEPTEAHFSLAEVHGALSLKIKNGFRGYHINSCYVLPKEIVAARVASNYTATKGATIAYGYYDGAEEGKTYIINKNTALVLLAYDGTYDFVLSSDYYEQISSNSLNGGEKAGVNTIPMKNNNLRYHYRFVANGDKTGFERNCETSTDVNLESKDEVYMTINGNDNHFFGNWPWETEDKKWISWGGQEISDFHAQPQPANVTFDFQNNNMDLEVGALADVTKTFGDVTISFTAGNNPGSRYYYNDSKGYHFNPSKNSTFTLKAAEGKAVKSVSIVFQNSQNGLTVDNGTYDAGTWTGNAEAVTFTAPGARYIYTIEVATGDADSETITEVKEIVAEGVDKKTPAMKGIYDLNGSRVNLLQKGNIYIIDGVKVIY